MEREHAMLAVTLLMVGEAGPRSSASRAGIGLYALVRAAADSPARRLRAGSALMVAEIFTPSVGIPWSRRISFVPRAAGLVTDMP